MHRGSRSPGTGARRTRGQSLVEFALVLPVVVLVVLMALDFGRVFMGWVSVNAMARAGASYAAQNPDAWAGPGNPAAQAEYQRRISVSGNVGSICRTPFPAPVFGTNRTIGQPVTVGLNCTFPIITPIIRNIVGGEVPIGGSSTFPISRGCVADCPPPPPLATSPPAPSHCRAVPTLTGLSVGGAREAWYNAGFTGTFTAPTGSTDTNTVAGQTVTLPPGGDVCETGKMFFGSTVEVTVEPVPPPHNTTCKTVPNLLGMTVDAARSAWTAAGFTGAFAPGTGANGQIVVAQSTGAPAPGPTPTPDPLAPTPDPAAPTPTPAPTTGSSPPGTCVEPDTTMTVTYGAPPPPPPEAPCKVPGFVNTTSATATDRWRTAGFTGRITLDGPSGGFTILSQTLVGGTWVSCDSAVTVSNKAPK